VVEVAHAGGGVQPGPIVWSHGERSQVRSIGRSTHEKSRDKASRSSRCKRVTMGGIGVEGFSWLPVGCRSVASRWPVGEKSGRGE
jgi:hypothetical protein